jgi:hypothetical protein
MGVRFPSQQQRLDFTQSAQQSTRERNAQPQQNTQESRRTDAREMQSVEQQDATPEARRPERNTQIERAAANNGAQTPGNLIDLIA